MTRFENAYFITGNAYAGKSTMIRLLSEKYGGVFCGENWHDEWPGELDKNEFPALTYTRDLEDWHDFIRRTPEEYLAWIERVQKECEEKEVSCFHIRRFECFVQRYDLLPITPPLNTK